MLLFDIETDSIDYPTTVHCMTVYDTETGEYEWYSKDGVPLGVLRLQSEEICAHNGIAYDVPVLERLFGAKLGYCHDTLIWSRFLYPDIYNHPIGGNDLKHWGEFLDCPKGDYPGPWDKLTPEMLRYNRQDVVLLKKVYEYLKPKVAKYSFPIRLEHKVAREIQKQVANGITFNTKAADDLVAGLVGDRAKIEDEFQVVFPPKPKQLKTKVKMIPFNPRSRMQFAARMTERYDWKPTVFTPTGKVKVDEKILSKMDWPEARMMERLELVEDRLEKVTNWIAAAERSWDGRVHGRVNTIGAVTFRMSHSKPNLAQVPKNDKPYGEECRGLFMPRPGWVMVGADLSGVELRLLSNLMWRFDDGAYAKIVTEGDPHAYNQKAGDIEHRYQAKNGIYCLIYGGGDRRLAKTTGVPDGRKLRAAWMANIPALSGTINAIKREAMQTGHVKLLDGRLAPVRSTHMALNTRIQGDAAILHKLAFVMACHELRSESVKWMLNIHDEQQIECPPAIALYVGETAVECMRKAGRILNIRTPIDGEFKIGRNWKETH